MIPRATRGFNSAPSAAQMIKSVASLAIFAVLGISVVALPRVIPEAEASGLALAKADRLAVQYPPENCHEQVWPNFASACLHNQSEAKIVGARLIN
jgi:hypothetical protein